MPPLDQELWQNGCKAEPGYSQSQVVQLYYESILRRCAPQGVQVPAQVEIAEALIALLLPLPDDEDGRAWAIFPAQHGVADQRADVEVLQMSPLAQSIFPLTFAAVLPWKFRNENVLGAANCL